MKSACGYNCSTKLEIMEGPVKLSGGGFTPLHVTAGVGYVLYFICNWNTESEDFGKLIRICYVWAASNAGVSFPLFEFPKKNNSSSSRHSDSSNLRIPLQHRRQDSS